MSILLSHLIEVPSLISFLNFWEAVFLFFSVSSGILKVINKETCYSCLGIYKVTQLFYSSVAFNT